VLLSPVPPVMCNDGKLGLTPRLSMVAATCADATELASRRKARPARVAVLMILTSKQLNHS
jgi:hypothetical protein